MEVTPHPPVRRWQEELDPAAQLGPYQPPVVLLDLLARWHAQGVTIVAALHEQDIVRQWFPHTLLLAREMIAVGPTAEVLTPENWQRAVDRSVAARQPSTRWCEGPTAIPAAASAVHRGADNAMPRV